MSNKIFKPSRWDDIEHEIYTKDEMHASDLRVALMSELIKARRERGVTQKKLEEMSGVSQPVIARLETGKTNPTIDTVIKLLAPLGMTLKVVSID